MTITTERTTTSLTPIDMRTITKENSEKIKEFTWPIVSYLYRSRKEQLQIRLQFKDMYSEISTWMQLISAEEDEKE